VMQTRRQKRGGACCPQNSGGTPSNLAEPGAALTFVGDWTPLGGRSGDCKEQRLAWFNWILLLQETSKSAWDIRPKGEKGGPGNSCCHGVRRGKVHSKSIRPTPRPWKTDRSNQRANQGKKSQKVAIPILPWGSKENSV